jgi:hypothetical protein
VTLVVAMVLGWWYDHWRLNAEAGKYFERSEFLEWRQQEIFTTSGVVSKQTWDKVAEAEAIQERRFAGQPPAKRETWEENRQGNR